MLICRKGQCCGFCLAPEVIMELNGDDAIAVSEALNYLDVLFVKNIKICRKCLKYLKTVSHFIANYVTMDFTFTFCLSRKEIDAYDRSVEHYASFLNDHNVDSAFSTKYLEFTNNMAYGTTTNNGLLHTPLGRKPEPLYNTIPIKVCKTEQNLSSTQAKDILERDKRNFGMKLHLVINCKMSVEEQDNLKKDIWENSSDNKMACTLGNIILTTEDHTRVNLRSHISQKSEGSLKIHLRTSLTNKKPHQCTLCHKSFSYTSSVKLHYRTHTNEKPYPCLVCKKSFSRLSSLQRHSRLHTNEKPHQCTVCKKSFSRKAHLKVHYRSHNNEKPYQCTVCRKSFSLRDNMIRHAVVHSNEKPYECTICKKSFSCKAYLTRHYQKYHTNERPHECRICKTSFIYKYMLKLHSLTHTDEKPFACTICKKSFNHKSILKSHYLYHFSEKPYECKICKKSFSCKRSLSKHNPSHTDEKPNKCTICKKSFSYKNSLKVHSRSHTDETPYECTICRKSFIYQNSFKRHLRSHTDETR